MLFHEQKKFIFIAVPKTGTSAIEEHLCELDPTVRRDELPAEDGNWVRVTKHAPLQRVRAHLGEAAKDYSFIGFFRDPRELAVSKYNWYRNGWPYDSWKDGSLPLFYRNRNWWKPSLAHRVLLARSLPISLWLRIYPFKPNAHFVLDSDGSIGLDLVGRFHDLQEDFIKIFSQFGYCKSDLMLPRVNVVKYEDYNVNHKLVDKIVQKRCRLDMKIADRMELFSSSDPCLD